MTTILLGGAIVCLTHILEAITGFGASVLAVPFLTMIFGVKVAVQMISILTWIFTLTIAIRNYRQIVWKQWIIITAFVFAGLPIGMYLFRSQQSESLFLILAIFILTTSLIQIIRLIKNYQVPAEKKIGVGPYLLLTAGGVIHGIFSSGGPLIIFYTRRALPEKSQFRATLCLLWATLNTIIIATYGFEGSLEPTTLKATALMLPFIIVGYFIGNHIHDRIDERNFSFVVFSMLFLTGIFMLTL